MDRNRSVAEASFVDFFLGLFGDRLLLGYFVGKDFRRGQNFNCGFIFQNVSFGRGQYFENFVLNFFELSL